MANLFSPFNRNGTEDQNASKAHTKNVNTSSILYYDLASESLEIRPIAATYGIRNLYRDVKDPKDIDDVEKKLSMLEGEAMEVIDALHQLQGPRTILLSPVEVESLRKYLFLVQFRSSALSRSYFQEDHPENARVHNWIKHFKQTHGMSSEIDVMLFAMRYYLDTPHSQILQDADESIKTHGLPMRNKHLHPDVDATTEDFHIITYRNRSDFYYPCIWEAADGEEFVLGNSSFGLCEGFIGSAPYVHRVFVVSPRIAFILRSRMVHMLHQKPFTKGILIRNSNLADIRNANNDPPIAISSQNVAEESELTQYPAATIDQFEFSVTKLTSSQTFELNRLILSNVRPGGAVGFLSKQSALSTLQKYLKLPSTNDTHHTRTKYAKLYSILSSDSESGGNSQSTPSSQPGPVNKGELF